MTATDFLMPLLIFSGPQAKPKMSGGRSLPDSVLSELGAVSLPYIALMSLRFWGGNHSLSLTPPPTPCLTQFPPH